MRSVPVARPSIGFAGICALLITTGCPTDPMPPAPSQGDSATPGDATDAGSDSTPEPAAGTGGSAGAVPARDGGAGPAPADAGPATDASPADAGAALAEDAAVDADAPAVDAGPMSGVDAAVVESHCGDGRIEGNEQCEYGVNAEGQTCVALALGTPPYATSTDPVQCDGLTCRWHAYNCKPDAVCGDGIVEGGESCDGADVRGATCLDVGRLLGNVRCTAGCDYDYSDCHGGCTFGRSGPICD